MEKSSKTIIRLLGIDYPVIYNDSEERMQQIGFYVDKEFNEVKLRNSKLSTTMIATLAAINIADEFFKQKEGISNERHNKRYYWICNFLCFQSA